MLLLQCVLPAGVEFYSSGFNSDDVTTYPRSYPIVLTGIDDLLLNFKWFTRIIFSAFILMSGTKKTIDVEQLRSYNPVLVKA